MSKPKYHTGVGELEAFELGMCKAISRCSFSDQLFETVPGVLRLALTHCVRKITSTKFDVSVVRVTILTDPTTISQPGSSASSHLAAICLSALTHCMFRV